MREIPLYSQYNGETHIALMDNSAISFMQKLNDKGFAVNTLLEDYDLILIPNWVLEEVNDSEYRKQYLEKLLQNGFPLYSIREEGYADLMNQEEGNLYKIIEASVSRVGELMQYLRRNVRKEDILDLEPSEKWIREMYANWPTPGDATSTGRKKKKNAGEISLTVLAEIFSVYYPNIHSLTIYTQDADTYEFQIKAEKKLKKEFSQTSPIAITYKSNDFMLCQLFRTAHISLDDVKTVRTDARRVAYFQLKSDKSVGFHLKSMDNEEFAELIKDQMVHIVF